MSTWAAASSAIAAGSGGPSPDAAARAGRSGAERLRAAVLARAAVLVQAALLLCTGSLPAQETGGQEGDGRVLGARLEARVPGPSSGGEATGVEIRYRVVADRTVDRIPIRGLAFFGLTPSGLRASVEGEEARSTLATDRAPVLSGEVELPRTADAGDTLDLSLAYRLPHVIPGTGGGFDVVLPVLFVDWKPAGAPEDLLRATLDLPDEYAVQEAFPTVPREITVREGVRRYEFQLQTVPSLVRFRGAAGDPPFFTFSRLVDLGVLLALGIGAAFGWRALQRQRARAEAEERAGRT